MMEGWHNKQQYIRARLSPGQYITEEEEEKIILQQVNICMSFTMKMLAVSLLVIAMMALTDGAEAEGEVASNTESPPTEKEVEPESTLDKEAEGPESGSDEDGTEGDTDSTTDEGKHKIAKRSTRCRSGWSLCGGRCFRYFVTARTWAEAQRHCQSMGGNLASVHNSVEDNWIRNFAHHRPTWLGLSDAEQERFWFWNDGTRLTYSNWCPGEPSDSKGHQNCLQINWTDQKCWDDVQCSVRKGYVCVHH